MQWVLRGWNPERGVEGKYKLGRALARDLLFVFHMHDVNIPAFIQDQASITELSIATNAAMDV